MILLTEMRAICFFCGKESDPCQVSLRTGGECDETRDLTLKLFYVEPPEGWDLYCGDFEEPICDVCLKGESNGQEE